MKFAEAIEHLKHGALIRRKGESVWSWLGGSGKCCFYGLRKDYPMQFRDSWLNSDVFADDWEIKEEGGSK